MGVGNGILTQTNALWVESDDWGDYIWSTDGVPTKWGDDDYSPPTSMFHISFCNESGEDYYHERFRPHINTYVPVVGRDVNDPDYSVISNDPNWLVLEGTNGIDFTISMGPYILNQPSDENTLTDSYYNNHNSQAPQQTTDLGKNHQPPLNTGWGINPYYSRYFQNVLAPIDNTKPVSSWKHDFEKFVEVYNELDYLVVSYIPYQMHHRVCI